jgi:hypothetical protein
MSCGTMKILSAAFCINGRSRSLCISLSEVKVPDCPNNATRQQMPTFGIVAFHRLSSLQELFELFSFKRTVSTALDCSRFLL